MTGKLLSGFDIKTFPDFNTLNNEDGEICNLLESWIVASHRYLGKFKDIPDNPWWYNERANVSILAGAAWLLNWIAFEEYSCRKKGKTKEKEVESIENLLTRYGRNDLYIGSHSQHFIFEAKHVWVSMEKQSEDIDTARKKAWDDILAVNNTNNYRRFAATFIIPFIPEASVSENGKFNSELLNKKIKLFRDDFKGKVESENPIRNTFYAYIFQDETGLEKERHYLVKKHFYPGVILILDEYEANQNDKIKSECLN